MTIIPPITVIKDGISPKIKKVRIKPNTGKGGMLEDEFTNCRIRSEVKNDSKISWKRVRSDGL